LGEQLGVSIVNNVQIETEELHNGCIKLSQPCRCSRSAVVAQAANLLGQPIK